MLCDFSSRGGETSLEGCGAGGEGTWVTFPASTVWCWLQQLALPLCVPCWALHTLHMHFPARPHLSPGSCPSPALWLPCAHLQIFPCSSSRAATGATNKVHGHIV